MFVILAWRAHSCEPHSHSCECLLGADQTIKLFADFCQGFLDPYAKLVRRDATLLVPGFGILHRFDLREDDLRFLKLLDRGRICWLPIRAALYFIWHALL